MAADAEVPANAGAREKEFDFDEIVRRFRSDSVRRLSDDGLVINPQLIT